MLKISLDVDDMSKNNNPFDASNQTLRYEKASKIILESIMRNKPITEGGANCPILVEGIKDERALRALGFNGIIEKLNRGYNRPKLIAYLYQKYGKINKIDGKSPLIVLVDWDKTGQSIQKFFKIRLNAMDVTIDEEMYTKLSKIIKPEVMTVESLTSFGTALPNYNDEII